MSGPSRPTERSAERASLVSNPWKLRFPPWLLNGLRHPATSYAAILLLQLKVVWGIWWYREIDVGDTSMYMENAAEWFKEGKVVLAQSPLYTTFLGSLMHLSDDAYVITTAHRLIILFVLAVLVLAVMRYLLPPGMAWLAAASWAVLPINYDAYYEVHLFAMIPPLLSILLVAWKPDSLGRGLALGVLLVGATLMRNENILTFLLLGTISLGWDIYSIRRKAVSWFRAALGYVVPLAVACCVVAYYYQHRNNWDLLQSVRDKQQGSICVAIAFTHMQQVGSWTYPESPFGNCGAAMQLLFGKTAPTLIEALAINPVAMLKHFWWDIRLLPAGIQVLLFNFRSGSVDPDYLSTYRSDLVLIPTAGLLLIVLGGLRKIVREWETWWKLWIKERAWVWLALISASITLIPVAIMNRPRPAYMFVLGLGVRALALTCFLVVCRRSPKWISYLGATGAACTVAVLLIPSFYQRHPSDRPVLRDYRHFKPYASLFRTDPLPVLVAVGWPWDLISGVGRCYCTGLRFEQLREAVTPERSIAQVLEAHKATLLFANPQLLADPIGAEFVAHADSYGWNIVGRSADPADPWMVLTKRPVHSKSPAN